MVTISTQATIWKNHCTMVTPTFLASTNLDSAILGQAYILENHINNYHGIQQHYCSNFYFFSLCFTYSHCKAVVLHATNMIVVLFSVFLCISQVLFMPFGSLVCLYCRLRLFPEIKPFWMLTGMCVVLGNLIMQLKPMTDHLVSEVGNSVSPHYYPTYSTKTSLTQRLSSLLWYIAVC